MSKSIELMENGPFPKHIDPWSEKDRYFHQMHAHMIGYLLDQLQRPMYERGYVAGRESSVQITSAQPDLFINAQGTPPRKNTAYRETLAILELEPGIELRQDPVELDRLFIQSLDTGELISVVEFVSPNNKIKQKDIEKYQKRREKILAKGVNVVEIDFTRSINRLLDNPVTQNYPYHIVIYPAGEYPIFLGMKLSDEPKTFGLPLRNESYPAELNSVYRQAYAKLLIAAQIRKAGDYKLEALPFPAIFSDDERQKLLQTLEQWQAKLS